MKATGTLIAVTVLVSGLALVTGDAFARSTDGRHAKPATQAASTPSGTQGRSVNPTLRGSQQRGRGGAARATPAVRENAASRSRNPAMGTAPGISCVPYVRQVTGMDIRGNGSDWWHNAASRYARDNRPVAGSVMAFPGSGGMRSGHVAVVERVVSSREVLIHHANWAGPGIRRGSIMRGVSAIDVSETNDWTRVRVQVGNSGEAYGRVYPVYGFIHNRPAAIRTADSEPTRVNAAEAARLGLEEVAQAPRRR
jgi:surface antigen